MSRLKHLRPPRKSEVNPTPATPRTAAACGCQCHGPYRWDICPHCRPDLLAQAAAPDGLREALAEVLDALQDWRDGEATFPGRRLSKAIDRARAALAAPAEHKP